MKTIRLKAFALPMAVTALIVSMPAVSANDLNPALLKEANISQAQATKTALTKVLHGVIKSSELEQEHGRLIWSFDIAKPRSKNIAEVNIDAKTGKIVAVNIETPAKEKREAKAER